jgi:hypothetical protein
MRLKSEMWVKAYLRACAVAGAAAVVVRHGDDDAGAIFIKINRLDGTARLFGPAPGGLDHSVHDRQWIAYLDAPATREAEVDAHLERQVRFDPDLWVIEVEDREGRDHLDGWLAPALGWGPTPRV